jgi:hypothetical protein
MLLGSLSVYNVIFLARSRPAQSCPRLIRGDRFVFHSNPSLKVAQLTPILGTQISSRLMVVLYQTLSRFWQSDFPLTRQPFPAEQEKQPVNNGATAKVEVSAPVTKSQEAPVSSEKPPLPASDSTPAPTTPDPEKEGQDSTVPTTTAGVPAEPGSRVPDAQERRRRRRLLIVHTRLARFFTWILLLGFVILPSTLTRDQGDTGGSDSLAHEAINHIANLGLYVSFRSFLFLFVLRPIIFEKHILYSCP